MTLPHENARSLHGAFFGSGPLNHRLTGHLSPYLGSGNSRESGPKSVGFASIGTRIISAANRNFHYTFSKERTLASESLVHSAASFSVVSLAHSTSLAQSRIFLSHLRVSPWSFVALHLKKCHRGAPLLPPPWSRHHLRRPLWNAGIFGCVLMFCFLEGFCHFGHNGDFCCFLSVLSQLNASCLGKVCSFGGIPAPLGLLWNGLARGFGPSHWLPNEISCLASELRKFR